MPATGWCSAGISAFERRAAHGKLDSLPQLLDELVASKVAIVIASGYPASLAAKQHTNLPVVVVRAGDPVEDGLVTSFSQPGGHVTGLSEIAAELSAKRLSLLEVAVPSVHRVAMLWNEEDVGMSLRYKAAEEQARGLGLDVVSLGVHAPEGFDEAFARMIQKPPDAILMVSDVLTTLNRKRVIDFAAEHKIPAVFEYDLLVREGGLMSYGPDVTEMFDRAASPTCGTHPEGRRSGPTSARDTEPVCARDQSSDRQENRPDSAAVASGASR